MKYQELKIIIAETLDKIERLNEQKNTEYASKESVFSNFDRAAGGLSFHYKKEMVAWEYAVKHLQSIKDIISNTDSYNKEVIDEKFNDAITYLLLIKAMCYENLDTSINNESKTEPICKYKYNLIK